MKKLTIKSQKGFAHWLGLIVFIVVFGLVGYKVFLSQAQAPLSTSLQPPNKTHVLYGPKGNPSLDGSNSSASQPATAAVAPFCLYKSCFYYVKGQQNGISATGAYAVIQQKKPVVGPNDSHSLIELSVGNPNWQQVIEVGWTVDKNLNFDSNPHLFVYHWVNGNPTCYNACGFINTPTPLPVGSQVTPGVAGTFQINFNSNQWRIRYNGNLIGYFPASIWGGNFKTVSGVKLYGEVAAATSGKPHSQMGNGLFGTSSGSARVYSYALLNSSNTPSLSMVQPEDSNAYNYGNAGPLGFNLGGPGYH